MTLAIWGTARGYGPFNRASVHESLVLLQLFMGVVAVTGLIAVVTLAYEAGTRWYRRRHPRPAPKPARGASTPPDAELNRWMTAVERVLGSPD